PRRRPRRLRRHHGLQLLGRLPPAAAGGLRAVAAGLHARERHAVRAARRGGEGVGAGDADHRSAGPGAPGPRPVRAGRPRPRRSQGPAAPRRPALDADQVTVFIAQTPEELAERTADRLASLIAEEVARSGACAVALSGGSTPGPILRRLSSAS